MGLILHIFLGLGIVFSYLLYTPVPTGFPNPWKYRLSSAVMKTIHGWNYMKLWIQDFQRPSEFAVLQASMSSWSFPPPREEVPGSNIRSRLTIFDGVKVRLYEPIVATKDALFPAFVYFHGGGMVLGNIDIYDSAVRLIAERLNVIGVAVEYRLAPEHPFPAGYDDSLAATKWLLTHANEFGVDPHRVAVGGDSAGGYLAATVSGAIADDPSVPNIKLQVLLYPWLQSLDFNTPSYQKARHTDFGSILLTANLMASFTSAYIFGHMRREIVNEMLNNNHTSAKFKQTSQYQQYVNHEMIPGDIRKDDFYQPPTYDHGNEELWKSMEKTVTSLAFSPLLRDDMSKLPRAYIVTFGYDVLRDDGIFYAMRLRGAGVPVQWINYEYGYHGISWASPAPSEIGRRLADGFLNYTNEYL